MNNLVGNAKPGFISSFLQHCLYSSYEKKKKKKEKAVVVMCQEQVNITYRMSDWCPPACLRNWRKREREIEIEKQKNTKKRRETKNWWRNAYELHCVYKYFPYKSCDRHNVARTNSIWEQKWMHRVENVYFPSFFSSPLSLCLSLSFPQFTPSNAYKWLHFPLNIPPFYLYIHSHTHFHSLTHFKTQNTHAACSWAPLYSVFIHFSCFSTAIFPQSLLASSFYFDLVYVPWVAHEWNYQKCMCIPLLISIGWGNAILSALMRIMTMWNRWHINNHLLTNDTKSRFIRSLARTQTNAPYRTYRTYAHKAKHKFALYHRTSHIIRNRCFSMLQIDNSTKNQWIVHYFGWQFVL